MSFNFAKLNKSSRFDFRPDYDTSDASAYRKLSEMYEEDGEGAIYTVRAIYINSKTQFRNNVTKKKEAPVFLLDDYAVNIPSFQIEEALEILADEDAIEAVNNGECEFHIEPYTTKYSDEQCYKVVFE